MLRHEPSLETQGTIGYAPSTPNPPPASGTDSRASTEELVAAIAAIEARRDASQRWQSDTISLRDAVQQLGLNVSAEELLAEIEAARSRRFMESQLHTASKAKRRVWVVLAIVTVAFLLLPMFLYTMLTESRSPEMVAPAHTVAIPSSAPAGLTLESLSDNQPAYSDLGSIYELNQGKNPAEVFLQQTQDSLDPGLKAFRQLWTVVKLNGKPYLRGWSVRGTSGKARKLTSVPLEGISGQTTVTVPFNELGTTKDPAEVHVQNRNGSTEYVEEIDIGGGK